MAETMIIERTRKGYPAIWEGGGSFGTGSVASVVLVCDYEGRPKVPIIINNRGDLRNGRHALFILNEYDRVIVASEGFRRKIIIYSFIRCGEISSDGRTLQANVVPIYEFKDHSWLDSPDPIFDMIIEAVNTKLACVDCTHVHYSRKYEEKVTVGKNRWDVIDWK